MSYCFADYWHSDPAICAILTHCCWASSSIVSAVFQSVAQRAVCNVKSVIFTCKKEEYAIKSNICVQNHPLKFRVYRILSQEWTWSTFSTVFFLSLSFRLFAFTHTHKTKRKQIISIIIFFFVSSFILFEAVKSAALFTDCRDKNESFNSINI